MKERPLELSEPEAPQAISRRDLLAGAAAAVGGLALVSTLGAPSTAAAQVGGGNEPLTAARFDLSIDGHTLGIFSSLESITSEVLPTTKRLPGKRTPPTVTLTRGMTRNIEMAAWHELVILGPQSARRSLSLTGFNSEGDPVMRYHLTDAWPSKVEIGALKAGASEVLMETVTIVAEFIQRVPV